MKITFRRANIEGKCTQFFKIFWGPWADPGRLMPPAHLARRDGASHCLLPKNKIIPLNRIYPTLPYGPDCYNY